MLIFEQSQPGRRAQAQIPPAVPEPAAIPAHLRRRNRAKLPEVSELQVVRHYTRLSQKNFSVDTQCYPLGSCTMKYNPRACNALAMLPGFLGRHPFAPDSHSQGFMACLYELQEILKVVTGMQAVSLTPAAGAQGEFAGVAMIRAYHQARGDHARIEMLVPDDFRAPHPKFVASYLANPEPRAMGIGRELFGRHRSGRLVPIEIGLQPIQSMGTRRPER